MDMMEGDAAVEEEVAEVEEVVAMEGTTEQDEFLKVSVTSVINFIPYLPDNFRIWYIVAILVTTLII